MSSSNLINLINNLKEEYKIYYSLTKKYFSEKIPQKNIIRKAELKETEQIISKINEDINIYINKYSEIIKLKEEINKEKQKEKEILEKKQKFSEFLEKGKNILTNNITYYKNLPEYSNKKLKTAKISPLDLINFTLRISQQNRAPLDCELYFQNYLPYNLNDRQNVSLIYNNYFIKNKNRFLYPYPNDFFGFKNTILRFDLSDKNRLLPPILESPDPKNINQNNEILANKGKDLVFKYPVENPPQDIFYKYSKDPNVIPSFFSGEEYKDYSRPCLDKNCIIKVCSCRKGFKDSEIITFKFSINSNEAIKYVVKTTDINRKGGDFVIRPEAHFSPGSVIFGPMNSGSFSPQGYSSRQGSSSHEPLYYAPGSNNYDDDDDDEI